MCDIHVFHRLSTQGVFHKPMTYIEFNDVIINILIKNVKRES